MSLSLNIHFTRVSDLISRDDLLIEPAVPVSAYPDLFGNWCTRIVAPEGRMRIFSDALINDSGQPNPSAPDAQQLAAPAIGPTSVDLWVWAIMRPDSKPTLAGPGTYSTRATTCAVLDGC